MSSSSSRSRTLSSRHQGDRAKPEILQTPQAPTLKASHGNTKSLPENDHPVHLDFSTSNDALPSPPSSHPYDANNTDSQRDREDSYESYPDDEAYGSYGAYDNAPPPSEWENPRPAIDQQRLQEWLKNLNEQQRQAVMAPNGPLLILAGAGTGKTRVIVTRVARIISDGISAHNVLCVTFTNRAAQEMRERIASMIDHPVNEMWIGTFHSMCLRMIRTEPHKAGFKPSFSIIDTDDRSKIIREILSLTSGTVVTTEDVKAAANDIEHWQNQLQDPDMLDADPVVRRHASAHVDVYRKYVAYLHQTNSIDFGHMILVAVRMLEQNPQLQESYHKRFNAIFVDEYQDINHAQYTWLRLICGSHDNICVVGDDDQSIYGWRGADVQYILKFGKDFPHAHTVSLERNYRSTSPILSAANDLIALNNDRYPKRLHAHTQGGELVQVVECRDAGEESRFIAKTIGRLLPKEHEGRRPHHIPSGLNNAATGTGTQARVPSSARQHKPHKSTLDHIGVLVRAWRLTRLIEEALFQEQIPYVLSGGVRFYDRQEIRDVIAYMRVAINPFDDAALLRIINLPRRGIGDTTISHLKEVASRQGVALMMAVVEAVDPKQTGFIGNTKAKALVTFLALLDSVRALVENPPNEMIRRIVSLTDYSQHLLKTCDTKEEAESRLENVGELENAARGFENVHDFMDHVGLFTSTDVDQKDASVSIMTIHAAKGTEFENVFLPAWENDEFPRIISRNGREVQELEEERRLAYVAITRAKKRLWISWAHRRAVFGSWMDRTPSAFLRDLPSEYVVRLLPHQVSVDRILSGHSASTASRASTTRASATRASAMDAYSDHNNRNGHQHRPFSYPQSSPSRQSQDSSRTYAPSTQPSSTARAGRPQTAQPAQPLRPAQLGETTPIRSAVKISVLPPLRVGDMVEHPLFGQGNILAIDGVNAKVNFPNENVVKLISIRFLTPQ